MKWSYFSLLQYTARKRLKRSDAAYLVIYS